MGQSITRLHELIKDDEDASAVVTVITDGLENASQEYSGKQLRAMIENLKSWVGHSVTWVLPMT